ncbi:MULTISPECIES: Na+/H+ antiporter subunit E [Rhizobium/Agrobacterium group]|jgi:multicomponent K+:H+ antiporter subunit E|uniref:Na+/H+ antiporter subunit E n=1 Tax=Rhizobium/Agrobacterium group TaxID=227290 RepID=UPI0006B916C8|nr:MULTISPECIES: Na+/H+ antiporter subunit E [Rhizobium/Agrobacterium group]AOG08749.1 na+/H+ ion antiporter subunit [Agrobacterium sp. RAC06]KPF55119.1 cation:proton antiporter [Rhizobium sp. AAP116]QGG89326.1 Na+/H+ antiporter subunit E [Agrobacterium sp. MA01]SIQ01281.1 multisubunit potassium/proton antiporter, PhaE subunit [Rhizobium sp. RU33A]
MIPHPLLSLALLLMWLLLNDFTLGHLVLGSVVAIFGGWAMASLRPDKPKIKKWYLLPKLFLIVFVDIIRSNAAVALLMLSGKRRKQTSGFITVPLEIEHPTALAIMAVILTSTPGSAWLAYDERRKTVLIHVLDLIDEEQWVANIKHRYERLLLEIIE